MPDGTELLRDLVTFTLEDFDRERFFLVEMHGREALSELYEFRVLASATAPLQPDEVSKLLQGTARIDLEAQGSRPIHGVVRELELVPQPHTRAVSYAFTLVPRLWYLTQTTRSRVWLAMSVPDVVKAVLADAGLEAGTDFELRQTLAHPTREWVIQYEETDFQFVARLLEHEGMCFFFTQGASAEKLVITDTVLDFEPLEGRETIAYRPVGGVAERAEGAVLDLRRRQRVVPRMAFVRDYQNAEPTRVLTNGKELPIDVNLWPVDRVGHGVQVLFGENARDVGDANRLAKLRAEEQLARKVAFTGRSDVRGLHAGMYFTLEEHFLDELNADYLLTAVEHAVEQEGLALASDEGRVGYFVDFEAIPRGVAYRPLRLTPRPRIAGALACRIDGADGGTEAPIDEAGRYRVVLPFDTVAVAKSQKASIPIRMAQPYAGPGYGLHFPLHQGAEVLVVFLGGDPERPVIVGAVPNPQLPAPVVKPQSTQGAIVSRSAIRIEWDDDA